MHAQHEDGCWLHLHGRLQLLTTCSSDNINSPTLTNRLLYLIRFMARPVGFFFFSCFGTLGVWPRTLPARASDPCTLPMAEK
jgi:hypothetical protein